MSAARCSNCEQNWPKTRLYNSCPLCGEPTWLAPNTEPMPSRMAARIVADKIDREDKQQAFENYYVSRVAATIDEEWAKFRDAV